MIAMSKLENDPLSVTIASYANGQCGLNAADSADGYYFGLVPPAKGEPLARSENLEARQPGPATVIAGRDATPVAEGPKRVPQITLEALPAGAIVNISVFVTNAALQSPRWSRWRWLN